MVQYHEVSPKIHMKKILAAFALVSLLMGQLVTPPMTKAAEPASASIQVLPSLSSKAVENGQRLTINALVKSQQPVKTVTAEIVELHETFPLQRNAGDEKTGNWKAEWQAHDLKEQEYHVSLKVTDVTGYVFEDTSLTFTDPILGINTPGVLKDDSANMHRIGSNDSGGVGGFVASAIDPVNNFIYYVTDSIPANVTKFDTATFSYVDSFNLAENDGAGASIAFDPVNQYIYVTTTGGHIIRGEANPSSAFTQLADISGPHSSAGAIAIDPVGQKLYFGGDNNQLSRVDINPSNTLAVEATLNSSGNNLATAVIDLPNQFLYVGTNEVPAHIEKIDLSTFSEVAVLQLTLSDNALVTSALDSVNMFAYFRSIDGTVQKVDVNPGNTFAVVGTLTSTGGAFSRAATIDVTNSYLYFASDNPIFEKLNLNTFTWETNLTPPSTENTNYQTSVLDPNTGLIYFGRRTTTANVLKLDPSSDTFVDSVDMPLSTSRYTTGFIDTDNDYGYFAYSNFEYSAPLSHGGVARVKLSDLSDQGLLAFNTLEDNISSVAVDKTNGFAYFGTNTEPALIVKVDLNTFSRVGSITLPVGEGLLQSAVMDEANGFAYFGSANGKIVKIDTSTFTEAGDSPLVLANNLSTGAAIDPTNSVAYFGTTINQVVKVDINPGNTFAETGDSPLVLNGGEDIVTAISLDLPGGLAYFSLDNSARVVKYDLNTVTEVDTLAFTNGENNIRASAIDLTAQKLYLTSQNNQIMKVDLPTFSADGRLNLPNQENPNRMIGVDPATSNLFVATDNNKGKIIKIAGSRMNSVNAYKVNLPLVATDLSAFHIYSHNGTGNLRLALYDSSFNLLWQSAVISNTTTNGWIDVDTNTGTPSTLTNLAAGDYWLAFQVDSARDIVSIAPPGASGDGYVLNNQSFGAFPSNISGGTFTDNKFAFYATYSLPPSVIVTPTNVTNEVSEGTDGNRAGYDEFSVQLGTQPTDDVTVTLNPGTQLGVNPTTLTFTDTNWNVPQYVTISAVDDALPEGNHTADISYTVSSADGTYNGIAVANTTVSITDNDTPPASYMASDLIGQYTRDGKVTFTAGAMNNGAGAVNANGFISPALPIIDAANHRLIFSDVGNRRVLFYNLDANNNLVDKTPDNVLGQPDFTASGVHTMQNSFGQPTGVALDPVHGLLFVADQAVNRVMVFDARPSGSAPRTLCGVVSTGLADGMDASCVLGQPDFNGSGSNTTQNTMSQPTGLAIDTENERVFVSEIGNNRITVYDTRATGSAPQSLCGEVTTGLANGMNASCVLGQPDFISNSSTTPQSALGPVLGFGLDMTDHRLFVPDTFNNRVMIFDVTTLSNGQAAVHVLGQPDFTTFTSGTTQATMSRPVAAGYDTVRKQLYITEFNIFGGPEPINNRVLIFDVANITDGELPVMVLGQPDFTTNNLGSNQSTLTFPLATGVEGVGHRLYAGDLNNNRMLKFEFVRIATTSLPDAPAAAAYNQALTSTRSQGILTYSLVGGALPAGLTLSTNGTLSGTPMTPGTYNFTVRVEDAVGAGYMYDEKALMLTVGQPIPAGGPVGGGGGGGGFSTPEQTVIIPEPTHPAANSNTNGANTNTGGGTTGSGDVLRGTDCTRNDLTMVPFTDTQTDWSRPYINTLYRGCIIDGKTEESFDPKGFITRAEVSKIALILFHLDKDGFAPVFVDVHKNDWFAPYILQGYKLGFLQGYIKQGERTFFRPNQTMTRAEALKVLLLAKGAKIDGETASFPDVQPDAWYYHYVAYATNKGIVKGYEVEGQPTKFAPDQFITREEFAKIAVLTALLPAGE